MEEQHIIINNNDKHKLYSLLEGHNDYKKIQYIAPYHLGIFLLHLAYIININFYLTSDYSSYNKYYSFFLFVPLLLMHGLMLRLTFITLNLYLIIEYIYLIGRLYITHNFMVNDNIYYILSYLFTSIELIYNILYNSYIYYQLIKFRRYIEIES